MPLAWSGLHPGAPIASGPGATHTGALGFLLAQAPGEPPRFALTAGHLFPPHAEGEHGAVFAGTLLAGTAPGGEARCVARLVENLLDLRPGERGCVDVALIELTEIGVASLRADGPALVGLGTVPMGGSRDARLWLGRRGRGTAPLRVRRDPLRARFRSPLRPEGYHLRDLLRTSTALSRPGDSGGPLVSAAGRAEALGLLVGRKGVHGVFEPLDRALDRLALRLGAPLFLVTEVPAQRPSGRSL